MKILISISIIILSTYIGFVMSGKFKEKETFFSLFYSFHEKLKREVVYSKKTIKSMLDEQEANDFKIIMEKFLKNEKINYNIKYLKQDDLEFIKTYCENIGVGNSKSQIEYLSSVDKEVVKMLNICQDNAKKYTKLYIKLGFLIGLMIMVVIL
ncbi:MAG: hypothetical protein E7347_03725 [Clostridiales bacterium]|nr:hypothetical protein [Clostridiales bacterium]